MPQLQLETMIVMRMASTPSLKASSRVFPIGPLNPTAEISDEAGRSARLATLFADAPYSRKCHEVADR